MERKLLDAARGNQYHVQVLLARYPTTHSMAQIISSLQATVTRRVQNALQTNNLETHNPKKVDSGDFSQVGAVLCADVVWVRQCSFLT